MFIIRKTILIERISQILQWVSKYHRYVWLNTLPNISQLNWPPWVGFWANPTKILQVVDPAGIYSAELTEGWNGLSLSESNTADFKTISYLLGFDIENSEDLIIRNETGKEHKS